jgi:hypothetical protein
LPIPGPSFGRALRHCPAFCSPDVAAFTDAFGTMCGLPAAAIAPLPASREELQDVVVTAASSADGGQCA